nr:unnamed protein product [Callosobruchus analis]
MSGQIKKILQDSTNQTKKMRVKQLLETWSPDELNFAAKKSMNQTGPSTSHEKCFSVQQALALYLDLDLSENKYLTLSSTLNALHPGLFPGLYKLRQYKKTIVRINAVTSELSAEAHFIIETVQPDSLENVSNSLTLVSKWVFDGSSRHSMYKQKITDTECTDEFLMLTAFVPLKLIDNRNRKEVWKNIRPSSTLFCRPIRFQYIKECKDVVKAEEERATSDIEKLQQFKKKIHVGEIISMSYLHCIVGSEVLRRISYKLPFKSWQVRGGENKADLLLRKREVQTNFKIKMGLLIDVQYQNLDMVQRYDTKC